MLRVAEREESHAIRISARGHSRRRRESCSFPPLRIEFLSPPGNGSLFRGQERLKLVTHCRPAESFQQHLLLEYAVYRLLNVLTPKSFRVRLARVDYVEAGRPNSVLSRYGFFVEDVDDVARRNRLQEMEGGNVAFVRLSAADTARFAIFQYMIGNVDWSAHAGPAGRDCCHNSRLLRTGPESASGLVPVPYDFDQSGMVDVPYAVVPPSLPLRSIRERRYRGYCIHNAEVQAAAAEARAARSSLERTLIDVPGLEPGTRRRAMSYMARFFDDVATSQRVSSRLLNDCRSSGAS